MEGRRRRSGQEIGVGSSWTSASSQASSELELAHRRPGFRIETYAADTELPPDILDTRWAHIKDVVDVGAEGTRAATIALGERHHKYRYVLLWFTTPPTKGPTVHITELKILG